ncbi:MAG: family 1 glycosylhydrolase [Candidatus Chromulinivorax sp.]
MKALHLFFSILILSFGSNNYSSTNSNNNFFNDTNKLISMLAPTAVLSSIGIAGYYYLSQPAHPNITVYDLIKYYANFPDNFIWGVSTSSTQIEEDSKNNCWTTKYLIEKGKPEIATPLFASKSWSHWQDDVDKVAYLGVQGYRLSIEWSRVQPTADTFDFAAIDHYVQICKALQAKNIAPMICLHHYSDPIWFLEIGGFSKEENILKFVQYCQKMYEALRPYVSQWIVISQPAAYAIKGYGQAMQPPFIKDSKLADIVMLNVFKAHIKVYDMMHGLYNKTNVGLQPSIGICHQISQMQANTFYNPLEQLVATFADRLYNQTLLRFFTNGHYQSLTPFVDIAYIKDAPKKFDFFALSYYCPKAFSGTTPTTPRAQDSHQTADPSRIIDKQGIYDAIVQASRLGKPVYVVESGIDPKNEAQRILLLNSYISAIAQAIIDGYDVRGYYHWTLMDNYEWNKTFNTTHFGLYKNRVINEHGDLDPQYQNHDYMLKESGKYYKNMIQFQKQTVAVIA